MGDYPLCVIHMEARRNEVRTYYNGVCSGDIKSSYFAAIRAGIFQHDNLFIKTELIYKEHLLEMFQRDKINSSLIYSQKSHCLACPIIEGVTPHRSHARAGCLVDRHIDAEQTFFDYCYLILGVRSLTLLADHSCFWTLTSQRAASLVDGLQK